jgi:hypothetical protein
MSGAHPPVRSLDRLATQCLNWERWPESAKMQHRSLGAIFGKLDRDENPEWLVSRPEVQSALAQVLGIDPDAIAAALKPGRAPVSSRWLNWEVMPYARGLDLVEEDLFPGVPAEVLHPGGWQRLIWVAPNGAGRTVTGQWLEARGLARHVALSDARSGIPSARPLLLELGSTAGLKLEALGAGICVAVPEPVATDENGWRVVRSPHVGELVEPLMFWVSERLATTSRVDTAVMVGMLREAAEKGAVRSVGDVLGLVGVADAFGFEAFEFSAIRAMAKEWFKRRATERLDRDAPGTSWLKRAGFDALVGLCRRVATDARESLFYSRSLEEWSALLPAELREGVDLDWLKAALPRADPNVRIADLERATEKLPPGAFRILRAFERLGLLERDGEERLALRPHWLVRTAFDDALERLVAGPAFDWGEALLSPSMAGITAERLLVRAKSGSLGHEELVDPDEIGDPAYAAASEGALRATGVSLLLGTAPAGDLLEGLWDEQLRIALELPGELPLPRIDTAGETSGERGAWLFDRGIWYLAALAVSEQLSAHEGRMHALLRPWQTGAVSPQLPALLDRVLMALERHETPRDLVGPALALVGRLRGVLGPLGAGGAPHRLERAAIVADEAALGVLAWENLVALFEDELGLSGFLYVCRSRKLGGAELSSALWEAFVTAGMPQEGAGIFLVPELTRLLLPHAPRVALVRLAPLLANQAGELALSDGQWSVLFDSDLRPVPAGLYRSVPLGALAPAVTAALRDGAREALQVLWRRFSPELSQRVSGALRATEPDAALSALLESAPPSVTSTLLEELDDVDRLLKAPGATLTAVRRFLHARVAERAPGFRDLYALLDEIERRCTPLRQSILY